MLGQCGIFFLYQHALCMTAKTGACGGLAIPAWARAFTIFLAFFFLPINSSRKPSTTANAGCCNHVSWAPAFIKTYCNHEYAMSNKACEKAHGTNYHALWKIYLATNKETFRLKEGFFQNIDRCPHQIRVSRQNKTFHSWCILTFLDYKQKLFTNSKTRGIFECESLCK